MAFPKALLFLFHTSLFTFRMLISCMCFIVLSLNHKFVLLVDSLLFHKVQFDVRVPLGNLLSYNLLVCECRTYFTIKSLSGVVSATLPANKLTGIFERRDLR